MTDNIGKSILFDIAGGHTIVFKQPPQAGIDEAHLKGIVESAIVEMLKTKTLDVVLSDLKQEVIEELKKDVKQDIVKKLEQDFRDGIDSITRNLFTLKRDYESFKGNFRVTKSYVSFGNKRLVSVAGGKDDNDVVTIKQLPK